MFKTLDRLPLSVAASQLTNPSMQGYLEKKRPSKTLLSIKYQRRWCVVYGNFFIYYNTPEDKNQKGSFSLEGYRFLHAPGHGPYGFSLVGNNKRLFEFMAPTNDAYLQWENAIKKGIALTRRSTVPVRRKDSKKSRQNNTKAPLAVEKSATLPNTRALPVSEKSATLPINMGTPTQLKLRPTAYGSLDESFLSSEFKDNKESAKPDRQLAKNPTHSNISQSKSINENKIIGRPDIKPVVTIITKDKQYKSKNRLTEISGESSESDGDGYINPKKLNTKEVGKKCQKQKSNMTREKSYTEDDYFVVLDDNSKTIENKCDPSDNNIELEHEKIYSSIKNRSIGRGGHDPDYASIRRLNANGPQWSENATHNQPSSREEDSCSSSSSNEDDFEDASNLVNYCKVDDFLKRLSADYERVDDIILPTRKSDDEFSSSCSDDEDLSDNSKDEYLEQIDRLKKDDTEMMHFDNNKQNSNTFLSVIKELETSPLYEEPIKNSTIKHNTNQENIYENF